MNSLRTAPAGAVDASSTVIVDTPCQQCGYNVRGLPASGRCPECGESVANALRGDLLMFSSTPWLQTLRRGISWILWGILAAILGSCLANSAQFALQSAALTHAIALAAGAVNLYGVWLLTEPDPSGRGESRYAFVRKFVRIAITAQVVAALLQIVNSAVRSPAAISVFLAILAGLGSLLWAGGEFAKLLYLERLAQRIPDETLAYRAKWIRWGYSICLAVMVVFGAIIAIFAMNAQGRTPQAGAAQVGFAGGACIVGLAGLALLFFTIAQLVLIWKFGKALDQQIAVAGRLPDAASIPAAIPPPPPA